MKEVNLKQRSIMAINYMEAIMRNRKKQQELIKAKVVKPVSLEEKLDLYDYCGIKDPTPYEAVKNMIRRGESVIDYTPQRAMA